MLAGSAVPLASRRTILSSSIVQAAEQGDTAAVDALLDTEGYVSIDCRSLNQSTLLHLASKNGHCHLTQRLLARGADVNALDYGGMRRTPLHWACKGGHVRMVELLVAHGADTKVLGLPTGCLAALRANCSYQLLLPIAAAAAAATSAAATGPLSAPSSAGAAHPFLPASHCRPALACLRSA